MPEFPGLEAIPRGSIIAPAGCGKTQEIVALVAAAPAGKPSLVLTHTNAGVAALRARLRGAGVDARAFRLFTIDAWCQRVVQAFPGRSGMVLDPAAEQIPYPAIKTAALTAVRSGALDASIRASYGRLLVDEYQDCDLTQHELVIELADRLPARVFGDPLQAIFHFAGPLVEWTTHVVPAFPPIGDLGTPWRWVRAGCPDLGAWLLAMRGPLERGEGVNLQTAHTPRVRWAPYGDGSHATEVAALRGTRVGAGENLLVIGNPTQPNIRVDFAKRNPGVAVVERADMPDLVAFAISQDRAAPDQRLDIACSFASKVMTAVDAGGLAERVSSIRAGRARKPPEPHEAAAVALIERQTVASLAELLVALSVKEGARVFRRELLDAVIETLSIGARFGTLRARACAVRDKRRFCGRNFSRMAIGSTLLLKGLESDHAVVLDADSLGGARHLYVAMTRGSRSLTVRSRSPIVGR